MAETAKKITDHESDEVYGLAALTLSQMKPPVDGNALIHVPGHKSPTIREVLDWAASDRAKQVLEADVRANLMQLTGQI
jgi:hypothetical protein